MQDILMAVYKVRDRLIYPMMSLPGTPLGAKISASIGWITKSQSLCLIFLWKIIIDRIASTKRGYNRFGSVHPSVCLHVLSQLNSSDCISYILCIFSEKHEDQHKPEFHKGMVIKFNANQRYATTAVTASILRRVAEKNDLPLQVRAF